MPKSSLKLWALSLLLAGVVLPQESSLQYVTPEVRRVGERLACKCGTCTNTVGNCPMLMCHYASPAREKIQNMKAEGKSDDQVVDQFVKESGLSALAVPPAEGFNLLGWTMPFIAIAGGLVAIAFWVRHFRRMPAPAAKGSADSPVDGRYQERIEREMAEMD